MRADSYHRSVLRCGCPVAERSHPTTQALLAAQPNVIGMFRNGHLASVSRASASVVCGSLRASNARVRLEVFFSGVPLGPY